MDARGAAAHRARLVAGLSGTVVEVGAGTGACFAHYPAQVTAVLAVEPDPYLRDLATKAATGAPVPVTVVAGTAECLPAEPGTFDAAVCSLVLCSVADPDAALAEIRRVLRPGGQLRFYEHVRSERRLVGLLEDAATPLWSRLAGGCHPNRDTAATIARGGFTITDLDRFGFAPAPLTPRTAHLLGRAELTAAGPGTP
ncbi:class I SAM-dependent methyltransferase [Dactylosporangium aurantiacum]|uniref:Class I SAM-dependent methyltransferase n=2 Tax=Dactylosporangium aurantiacum TaxID=35754 RepID=A0A9Q9MSU2_9ACTN|nr:class I SAM-dependent methyltransferase [Dactylosporangium aurantiacum]